MKRVLPFVAVITLVSVGAWAQTPPPQTPPPPPPPPMLPVPPAVVATPVPPMPMPAPAPTVLWRGDQFAFTPMTVQMPAMPPMTIDTYPTWHSWADQTAPVGFRGNGSDTYSQAIGLFERRQYEQAIASFDRVIAQKGTKTDAAMHWKAFSQFRLGR